jgi:hypothetical protein
MRISRGAALVAFALVVAMAWAAPAWGWGDAGHTIVCEIAFQELNEKARREVSRLVRSDPEFTTFAASCTWPDHPQQRACEHFINAPRSFTRFAHGRCPMAPNCLFSAIPGDLRVLRTSTNDQAKLAALKFLGHWIGDLHQPLHVSFQDDRGGNRIREAGPCSGSLHSLHSVWDTCILERGLGTRSQEVARALRSSITAAERANWTATPVVAWANESFLIARSSSVQYCFPAGPKCIYAPGNEQFQDGEAERLVTVDVDYIEMHKHLVAARLKQAGIRLAHLLNTSLGR